MTIIIIIVVRVIFIGKKCMKCIFRIIIQSYLYTIHRLSS